MTERDSSYGEYEGATVVITHRVKPRFHPDYEDWLWEIMPLCTSFAGHLDSQVVRPVHGLTATYTFIVRFDTREHLEAWMHSPQRKRLIEKIEPLLTRGDGFSIRTGIDFWFRPDTADARVPVGWKQLLVTLSAIYPLALYVPLLVIPRLRTLGLASNQYVDGFFVSSAICALMVYVVMPHYTRLLKSWLTR